MLGADSTAFSFFYLPYGWMPNTAGAISAASNQESWRQPYSCKPQEEGTEYYATTEITFVDACEFCAGPADTGGTGDEGLPASKLADAALLLHPWQ